MKVDKTLGLKAFEAQFQMNLDITELRAAKVAQDVNDLQNLLDEVEVFLRQLPAKVELPEAAELYVALVANLMDAKQLLAAFYSLMREHSLASTKTESQDWDSQNVRAAASKAMLALVFDEIQVGKLIASMRGNMNTLKYALKPI